MTQHITQEQIEAIYARYGGNMVNCAHSIARQSVANYIDQRKAELPVLPEPTIITDMDWCENETYDIGDMQAYGAACAAHARDMALSDAKAMGKTLTYQPTDPIDFTAYQEGYMDAITEFYAAIEELKGK